MPAGGSCSSSCIACRTTRIAPKNFCIGQQIVANARRTLGSLDEGVVVDGPGMRGSVAQGLAVGLAGLSDVRLGDRRERDKLDGVDLDQAGSDPVAAALLDLWPLPQPNRQRDIAGRTSSRNSRLKARLCAGDARPAPARHRHSGLAIAAAL